MVTKVHDLKSVITRNIQPAVSLGGMVNAMRVIHSHQISPKKLHLLRPTYELRTDDQVSQIPRDNITGKTIPKGASQINLARYPVGYSSFNMNGTYTARDQVILMAPDIKLMMRVSQYGIVFS